MCWAPTAPCGGSCPAGSPTGTLWQEQPGWQISGRTSVNPNAQGFTQGSGGYNYELGTATGGMLTMMNYMIDYLSPLFTTGVLNNLVVVEANPTNNGKSVNYTSVSASLYNPNTNVPSYQDVRQGTGLGDCWLLASLAEVAAQAPNDIKAMITDDGWNGSNEIYTVRFYDYHNGVHYVVVDDQLPLAATSVYPVNGSYWVALVEKAYAVANGDGYVTTGHPGKNDYQALDGSDGGDPTWALQAITGKSASGTAQALSTADFANWQKGNGQLLVLNTNSSQNGILPTMSPVMDSTGSYNIEHDHAYAVVDLNTKTQQFTLYNPWGVDQNGIPAKVIATAQELVTSNDFAPFLGSGATHGVSAAPPSQPSASFTPPCPAASSNSSSAAPPTHPSASFTSATTPRGQGGRHAWSSQELADQAFIEDLLGAPSKDRRGGVVMA
jgi:hypothetical protein